MTYPLVSIIIPCYQAAKTIRRTIADLLHQDYPAIEIIAVDDGSTDRTASVLQEFAEHITIIRQPNRGAAAARNKGFEESHGEYVFFCDADVRAKPHMISALVDTLSQHPEAAYCYCNFRFGFHTFDLFPFDPERLKQENYISTMSLIRRNDFIGFNEQLSRYQDWDLWKRMLRQGKRGVWHNERLFSAPLNWHGISRPSLKNIITIISRRIKGKR